MFLDATTTQRFFRQARVFAAVGVLEAVAGLVAPPLFTQVYAATVGAFPVAVFLAMMMAGAAAWLLFTAARTSLPGDGPADGPAGGPAGGPADSPAIGYANEGGQAGGFDPAGGGASTRGSLFTPAANPVASPLHAGAYLPVRGD